MADLPHGAPPHGDLPDEQAPAVEYRFLADQGILVVRSRGVMPSSGWAAITLRATKEGSRHSSQRYLFDHREAKFRLRFADLWSLPRNMGAFKLPGGAPDEAAPRNGKAIHRGVQPQPRF